MNFNQANLIYFYIYFSFFYLFILIFYLKFKSIKNLIFKNSKSNFKNFI